MIYIFIILIHRSQTKFLRHRRKLFKIYSSFPKNFDVKGHGSVYSFFTLITNSFVLIIILGLQYPYLVCNIGSGVSIVVVRSHNDFKRVSGSSIGGGFFQGLCFWLCGCETFEEAIELATKGDNKKVDKLVGDIYGKAYDAAGLPSDTIAARFGSFFNKVY